MKSGPMTLTLAAVMAASTVGGATAQTQYQRDRERYEDQRSDYQARREAYQEQRDAYEAERARYERDRAEYDRRYGMGAYERRYGAFRAYDDWARANDGSYRGYSRWDNRDDYYSAYRDSPCERQRSSSTVAGGLIGALAGAALGSNIAGSGVRTEGAILGAVVGGAAGASIGRSTAKCDSTGYYFSYDQTYPYREDSYYAGRRSGRYDDRYYRRIGCRLAVAPAEWRGQTDYRYVRVCPDRRGRYRITS